MKIETKNGIKIIDHSSEHFGGEIVFDGIHADYSEVMDRMEKKFLEETGYDKVIGRSTKFLEWIDKHHNCIAEIMTEIGKNYAEYVASKKTDAPLIEVAGYAEDWKVKQLLEEEKHD